MSWRVSWHVSLTEVSQARQGDPGATRFFLSAKPGEFWMETEVWMTQFSVSLEATTSSRWWAGAFHLILTHFILWIDVSKSKKREKEEELSKENRRNWIWDIEAWWLWANLTMCRWRAALSAQSVASSPRSGLLSNSLEEAQKKVGLLRLLRLLKFLKKLFLRRFLSLWSFWLKT